MYGMLSSLVLGYFCITLKKLRCGEPRYLGFLHSSSGDQLQICATYIGKMTTILNLVKNTLLSNKILFIDQNKLSQYISLILVIS